MIARERLLLGGTKDYEALLRGETITGNWGSQLRWGKVGYTLEYSTARLGPYFGPYGQELEAGDPPISVRVDYRKAIDMGVKLTLARKYPSPILSVHRGPRVSNP